MAATLSGLIGGAEGNRTPDLRIANATLSHLSYGPAPKDAGAKAPAGADYASGRYPCQGEHTAAPGPYFTPRAACAHGPLKLG